VIGPNGQALAGTDVPDSADKRHREQRKHQEVKQHFASSRPDRSLTRAIRAMAKKPAGERSEKPVRAKDGYRSVDRSNWASGSKDMVARPYRSLDGR
jgi:hypothetical protein